MTTKLIDLCPHLSPKTLQKVDTLEPGDWFIAEDGDLGVRTVGGVLFMVAGEFCHYADAASYCVARHVDVEITYR